MSQAERLYLKVRKKIIEGGYQPGRRLRENDLAVANGISRTPVREALSRLLAEGYVDRVGGRGHFVSELTVKGLKDTIEIRRIVEAAAATLAAERATPEQRRRLPELANFVPERRNRESYDQALNANRQFHLLIAHASQNAVLVDLVNYCLNQMSRYLALGLNLPDRYWRSIDDEHHHLAEAIVTGRSQEARELMEQHLEDSNRRIMDALVDAQAPPSDAAASSFPAAVRAH